MTANRQQFRYVTPEGAEGESEPGSRGRVLRNLLGVTRKREMDRAEYEALIQSQEIFVARIGPETRFTADLICEMHRRWLGGLYAWAGEYRTVELQKGSFRWPPADLVERNMQAFESGLLRKHTPCAAGTVSRVARAMAEVHGDFLLIHPFRDGNGRLARWLADLMALQAGMPAPKYDFEGRTKGMQRSAYLAAVTRA
jgi:cell filamentation protein